MPAKIFLQLRLPVACFAPTKLEPQMLSSTASFSRLFPFRLKYQCLGFQRAPLRQTSRRLSTRSGSELSASRGPKSLIDDEAELSDWVTELREDPPRGGRNDSSRGSRDDSDGDWSGGIGGSRVRSRGGNGDSFSGKRTRTTERSSNEYGRRESPRSSNEFGGRESPRSSPTNRRFEGNDRASFAGKRSPRDSPTGRAFENRREERNGDSFSRNSSARFQRQGDSISKNSSTGRRFDTKRDGEQRDFLSKERSLRFEKTRPGLNSSMGKRGGERDMYKKSETSFRKQPRFISEDDDDDEDDDEEIDGGDKFGIEDLLSDESEEEEEVVLPKKTAKVSATDSTGKQESYLSETRFDQFPVSPLTLRGIKDAGFEKMTVVQEATLPVILKGKDVLAKAKTGTGKTVAFLLPSIEVIVNSASGDRDQKRPPIVVLVMCPTRELANQAAAEAGKLLKYHPSIGVQVVIGGTRLALEQKRLQANPCQILVATPGRLKDHMENTAGFATRMMGVKVLVLDEADHLLDMGFRKDIEKIIASTPKQRQTLLFSATVPDEVRQVCHIALKRDHEFINTVHGGSEDTHSQVRQMHLVAPLDKHFSYLHVLLKEHIADDVDYKVIVFCTTAMVTKLVAELLGELNMNVREIHSRKSQSYRTKVSDEFRKSKGLILVTSDVSARGVDYPDVTLVIQVGVPADKQQYIHRLGRTGRKGKEGEGVLMLAPWEQYFLSTIKDLPLSKAPEPSVDPDTKKKVERALSNLEMKSKESAYQAWLGYYNSNKNVGRDKHVLVQLANEFSRTMGLDNPPAIPKMVLGKMGLKNVPGLRSR